ncbi:alanine or glycine:cation symporter, AGCS family [Maridesulfovibrio ferrireducens]|uniref:Alanine or glycine:cation symporter, AGCS family n=1 Tax=Maridesulfovibrio ferrireducens TaxID=246191 RepID=A0A1G9CV41_9BACT|nr:sodium:alanine symporter family protein [Maridesulfovibrio ferrireducens]SDK55506.1 alanine or glycine:cation symporter, AGCS family [Maridesulfovibrio ferrireducens]
MDFLSTLDVVIGKIGAFAWGPPMLILLVGTGCWLTYSLRGIQFSKLWHALYLALVKRKEDSDEPGDITHFQALMTALSATVGTGNIAGVATAIAMGGPGALFWMWVTGLVGMATKYAEAVLAVKYRVVDENGEMSGGPMYYISSGLKMPWLGTIFAICASVAAFGIGNMVQSNSVADAVESTYNISPTITGIILMVCTAAVILGGIKKIGKVTGLLVPVMIVFYMAGASYIIITKIAEVPAALIFIVEQAFNPTAAIGGFAGASIMMCIRMGVARGVFSNESGLGSAPIAAAAAQTKSPITQALVSMTQTFIDTIVVCTMTGLVLILTGTWSGGATGAELTTIAFAAGMPGGAHVVTIGLILFAYSTILGWSYYGEKSIEYLLGIKAVLPYRVVFVCFVGIGAIAKLSLVWNISDTLNGLMAIPNLIGLLLLTPVVVSETNKYFKNKETDKNTDIPLGEFQASGRKSK